jgi:oligopeptide transport system substrate-binding protein
VKWRRGGFGAALCVLVALAACTNDPYPDADTGKKLLYLPFDEPPKTLDPQVAYSTIDHSVIGNVYDTLLEYHYLKRPYTLIPGLATSVPTPQLLADGRVSYRFQLREDLLFQDDPAFGLDGQAIQTRQVLAKDVAFSLARIADPEVNSPVFETLAKIDGLRDFSERLKKLRAEDPAFAQRRIDEQYALAGPISGVRVPGPLELEIVLSESYPQILYWFAMPFTTPVPWEGVVTYDGRDGRDLFSEHPTGTGPWKLVVYDKRLRIALRRNPNWYGIRHPEWRAPGAIYPGEGESSDTAAGRLVPSTMGRALPFLEGIEFRREKESIPAFAKFLQGYYDASGIIKESFDRVIRNGELSPEMAARGVSLSKSVLPATYYLGFNMDDPVVGREAGEGGRKLREAMSLAIDSKEYARLFTNGRGIPAESPIPPGIFGYEADYRNPYREVDLERARTLLAEAGYPGGIDPKTGAPLKLSFDSPDTSAAALLQYQFFVDAWRRIGLDVSIAATSYNQFQDKVRRGAYQIFQWGWVADYPDPENFLFLLWTPMGRTHGGGPNTANFSDPRYDELFLEMKARGNDERRLELIRKMRAILEEERPWIELFHPESYLLAQGWLHNEKPPGLSIPTAKYLDIDTAQRAELRSAWNQPIRWPAYAAAGLSLLVIVPGIFTYLRERQ